MFNRHNRFNELIGQVSPIIPAIKKSKKNEVRIQNYSLKISELKDLCISCDKVSNLFDEATSNVIKNKKKEIHLEITKLNDEKKILESKNEAILRELNEIKAYCKKRYNKFQNSKFLEFCTTLEGNDFEAAMIVMSFFDKKELLSDMYKMLSDPQKAELTKRSTEGTDAYIEYIKNK